MKTHELFDEFKIVCNSDKSVRSYYLPVKVDVDIDDWQYGQLCLAQVADKLVSHGFINEQTAFAVTTEDMAEIWVELELIEIAGPSQPY